MNAMDVRGRFVWHQLFTRDLAAARGFYPALTGWQLRAFAADESHTVCVAQGRPTAGLLAIPPGFPADMPSHWLQYVGSRDVDGTVAAAVRAGASVISPPTEMAGAGRYAVLADPQGAVFATLNPRVSPPEPAAMPAAGQFSWHELATTDHEAAFAFYHQLFGWEATRRIDMGSLGVYLVFGYGGVEKGGIYLKPAHFPGPPHWLVYTHVPSVDQAASSVSASGGQVVQPPMEVPGGSRILVALDPAGAAFALQSFLGATPAAAAPRKKTRRKSKSKRMARKAPASRKLARKKSTARKAPLRKKMARKPPELRQNRSKRKATRRKK